MPSEKLPIHQPDWIAAATFVNGATKVVAAPAARVWELVADHERWPEWFTAIDSVIVTGAAEGVGGTRRIVMNRLAADEVFTVWEPERHFAFAVARWSMPLFGPMAESVTIEPLGDDRCSVTYRQGVEPARFRGILLSMSRRRLRDALRAALDNLARLAEAG